MCHVSSLKIGESETEHTQNVWYQKVLQYQRQYAFITVVLSQA